MADAQGSMRFFPYASPYEHQREAIDRIHDALAAEEDVLFEGACGTGKTLAALVPALDVARAADKTVVITTNVHQQMRQFVQEARAITRQQSIRGVVFRGKSSMCHIDVGYEECQALRETTRELVDVEQERAELEQRERALLRESQKGNEDATEARSALMDDLDALESELESLREGSICEHYYRNRTADTDPFYEWLFEDVRTPDEIYDYAHGEGLCGYELLKEGIEGVDLVVCNYHHLLDPFIREQFFRWLGRDPADVIAVFDEAHNIEDAARDHATRTLAETTLQGALDELSETDDPRAAAAESVIEPFLEALVGTYDAAFGVDGRQRVGEGWQDVTIANGEGRDDLTLAFLDAYAGPGIEAELEEALALGRELDTAYERAYKQGETATRKECRTLQAARFVDTWLAKGADPGRYPVVSVRRGDAGVYGRSELYTCIPRDVTADLFGELSASVLMSATLRPFEVVEDVLGLEEPVSMAYGQTFPETRRRTYAVEAPPLFASRRDDPEVQATVTGILEDTVRFTPGNTLAFFPSYAEARRYHDLLDVTGSLYLDESGTSATELRESFVADDDGTLLTSLWGTLAEGVSYDDGDARTVAVVGVPYPRLDDRMDAVQDAYDEVYADSDDAGWEYAVEIPTVRKTRQAVGRVVRSPTDFGARVLIDKRYTSAAEDEMGEYSVRGTFPPEERSEMIDVAPEKLPFALLNFYSDMDAWDGSPPEP